MNIKRTIILLAVLTLSLNTAFGEDLSQTRFSKLTQESVSSVKITRQMPGEIQQEITIEEKGKIEKLITFIKSVDYVPLTKEDYGIVKNKENWSFRIVFQGFRDQVFYFKNKAFLGKSTFKIQPTVLEDLEKLLSK